MQDSGAKVKLRWPKISRKRFIGAAMYFGLPYRAAVEMADCVKAMGFSYRQGTACLLKALQEVHAKEEDALNF